MLAKHQTKAAFAFILFFICSNANAQIVIGPATAQEVPIFGAPLLIALGGFLAFLAYKLGFTKQAQRTSLAILCGVLGFASISAALYPATKVEAGTNSNHNVNIAGNSQASHSIFLNGDSEGMNVYDGYNRYDNNSGITLRVISISLPGACADSPTANRCTAGATIADGSFCAIDCNGP